MRGCRRHPATLAQLTGARCRRDTAPAPSAAYAARRRTPQRSARYCDDQRHQHADRPARRTRRRPGAACHAPRCRPRRIMSRIRCRTVGPAGSADASSAQSRLPDEQQSQAEHQSQQRAHQAAPSRVAGSADQPEDHAMSIPTRFEPLRVRRVAVDAHQPVTADGEDLGSSSTTSPSTRPGTATISRTRRDPPARSPGARRCRRSRRPSAPRTAGRCSPRPAAAACTSWSRASRAEFAWIVHIREARVQRDQQIEALLLVGPHRR